MREILRARAPAVLLGLVLLLLTTGCLEQLSTTRIPGGAARNFLYFLIKDQQTEANAYWAPGKAPPDAAAQVAAASRRLRGYTLDVLKADSAPQPDGATIVTLTGRVAPGTAPAAPSDTPLLRARLIAIGPGWRITEFTVLCCEGSGTAPTPTP